MSEELQEYEDQLIEIICNITTSLDSEVSNLLGPARLEKCEYLKNRLNRGRQLIKSINVELREIPTDKRQIWQEKSKSYDAQLNKLQQDLNWAITSAERDGNQTVKGVNEMNTKEITKVGLDIQSQSIQATTRTKQVISTTIQLGTETVDVLKAQSEQVNGISENLDMVESNLKRADKQVRAFIRKLATDRIIMMFVFLIVLAILGVILVNVFGKSRAGKQLVESVNSIPGINSTLAIFSPNLNGGNVTPAVASVVVLPPSQTVSTATG